MRSNFYKDKDSILMKFQMLYLSKMNNSNEVNFRKWGALEVEERKTAMSHDEMQDYWKTLCSFTSEDIPK